MYTNQTQQSACFDPIPDPNNNSNCFPHDQTTTNTHTHLDDQLDPSIDPHLGNLNLSPNCSTEIQPNNWNPNSEMGFPHFHEDINNPTSNNNSITDLLTTLQLPKCSISFGKSSSPSSSSGFLGFGELNNNNNNSNQGYDPLFHLNFPNTQPSPSLRDLLLQQIPDGYNSSGINMNHMIQQPDQNSSRNGNFSSLFGICGFDNNTNFNNGYGIYQDGDNHNHHNAHTHHNNDHNLMHGHGGNGIFEFNSGNINPCLGEGLTEGKCPKNFVTERQRRQNFNDKYQHLKSLVPNPTKGDKASIVKDAIDYIMELKRTVSELKLLVEKKRITKERHKRLKHNNEDKSSINAGEDDQVQGVDGDVLVKPDPDQDFDGLASTQLRSSWLQRKCKDTEVDVRIVDDEVTIKLVQRKKINCLLSVSRTLDELQLDLRHVAGGHVGDYYSYLFNSKICEGSSVYASAIANKLIEVVERQYASASVALQPTTSF